MRLEGIYVPNVTPFNANGEILFESLGSLLDYWIISDISGVVVNASTGEAPFLNNKERQSLIEYVSECVDGRIDVIAGTGAMGTRETIKLTEDAKDSGAKAALVTTPFFYKPTDEELFQHFSALLSQVDFPVILYNVPKFTGYSIKPLVVAKIAEECDNLIGIKDSSGNPGTMSEIIRLCGDKIDCLSGAADMILPTLMLGGKGAVVAVANVIPEICVALYKSFKSSDLERAGRSQIIASHVNNVLVRQNPQIASIKTAMNQMGYETGFPRKPLLPLKDELSESIYKSIGEYYHTKTT